MKTFVAAEFDSVDLADLASGRVKGAHGVIDTEVSRNKLALDDDHDSWLSPTVAPSVTPTVTNSPFAGFMGVGSFLAVPFDDSEGRNFEPAQRHDALLRVEVSDDKSAQQVSSVLRNVGGRNISIIHR